MSAAAVDLLTLANSLSVAGETDRALAVLDIAASANTDAAQAFELKGDLLRSRGELQLAAEAFDQVARRQPDHPSARYLSDLLAGSHPPIPAVRPAPWPSPFVRVENFLNQSRHREVLRLVTSRAHAFEPSTVGATGPNGREPRVILDSRTSFRLVEIDSVAAWLRPLIEERLSPVMVSLGVAPFTIGQVELKCTAYGDGNFFAVHSDSLHQPTRRISFVYYFHQLPKRYSGGALLLYDGDVADPSRYFPDRVTRLETLDNSIVFFPSGAYHEVARVVSPSGAFEDSRFTFAGHVHVCDAGESAPDTTTS
jgi:SM-20-related protein